MRLPPPLLGAIAIVATKNHVLLARRANPPDAGLWGFPGGHVELGETALDAAARELFEETGVSARPVEYLTNIDVLLRDDRGTVIRQFLLAAVLCDFERGVPQAADDVQEAAWVSHQQVRAGTLPMSERVAWVMDLAIRRNHARRA
ncbi:NUDIX hydrolase [Sedimentitalea nanhaiensis]|uniref:Mutator mutT protein n=1 Tax=Sedimentitalea nanhaiensis TaxID=999627 RepID=A0A1I7CWE3_9RHOB|nr:NUDIX hydrolase [Sedimentitalea nanhaiensis]SFU03753.1 mutator mutT protein [Sedimentitalea nanhaiensis]